MNVKHELCRFVLLQNTSNTGSLFTLHKADRCVNSPGFDQVVSLDVDVHKHTQCRPEECERCPGRRMLSPSPWAEVKVSVLCGSPPLPRLFFFNTLLKDYEEKSRGTVQTPDDVSGVSFSRSCLTGCMVGASHLEGCEEGSSVEGSL